LSGQFLQRSLFAAVEAILGAIFTSHTHRNVTSQPKYGQIINCGLTILIVSLFSLCRLRTTTQLRSSTVDISKWPVFLQHASGNPTRGPNYDDLGPYLSRWQKNGGTWTSLETVFPSYFVRKISRVIGNSFLVVSTFV